MSSTHLIRRQVAVDPAAYAVMQRLARGQGMPWSTWARIELYRAVVRCIGVARAREIGIIGPGDSFGP